MDWSVLGTAVLSIRRLTVEFPSPAGWLKVVQNLSLDLAAGEHTALLGETGCGKSVLAAAVFGLLPPHARTAGTVSGLGSENLLTLTDRLLNRLRGRDMVLIPQNPHGSLNPVFRVVRQLAESIRLSAGRSVTSVPDQPADLSQEGSRNRLPARIIALASRRGRGSNPVRRETPRDLLAKVGFDAPELVERMFPHQLSGGMAQRVLSAAGLAASPQVVFADEPTKGLDSAVRNHCLELLRSRFGKCALVLITHDLKAAVGCERVAVMYAGEIVEICPGGKLLSEARHPYTQGLIAAHPAFGMIPIPGSPPSPLQVLNGCRFYRRCSKAEERCRSEHPQPVPLDSMHWARCFHADD
jgi:peptide/nickel transport system ATP-binding protein